jgi:hypothetical protein
MGIEMFLGLLVILLFGGSGSGVVDDGDGGWPPGE